MEFNAKFAALEGEFSVQKVATNARFRDFERKLLHLQDFSGELVGRLDQIRKTLDAIMNANPSGVSHLTMDENAQREMATLKADMRGVQESIESDVRLVLECIIEEYLVNMSSRLQRAERRLGELEKLEKETERDGTQKTLCWTTSPTEPSTNFSKSDEELKSLLKDCIEESAQEVFRDIDAANARRIERAERSLAQLQETETDAHADKVHLSRRLDKAEHALETLEKKEAKMLAESAHATQRLDRVDKDIAELESRIKDDAGDARRVDATIQPGLEVSEGKNAVVASAAKSVFGRTVRVSSPCPEPSRISPEHLSVSPTEKKRAGVTVANSPPANSSRASEPTNDSVRKNRSMTGLGGSIATMVRQSSDGRSVAHSSNVSVGDFARHMKSVRSRSHDTVPCCEGASDTYQQRSALSAQRSLGTRSPRSLPMPYPMLGSVGGVTHSTCASSAPNASCSLVRRDELMRSRR